MVLNQRITDQTGGFYGRRKGKRLRQHQGDLLATVLPKLRVPDLAPVDLGTALPAARSFVLEIGFGGGEHLAAQARRSPEVGFIGCEPFVNGIAKLLVAIEAEALANVRIWDRDAAELLQILPDASLDRVYILYPDPWPKRRQRKRRFVSRANLSALARVMRSGGELRFATDIDDYAGWALARVFATPHFRWAAHRPDDWRVPWEGWASTRYETKALREGRRPSYLTFVRR